MTGGTLDGDGTRWPQLSGGFIPGSEGVDTHFFTVGDGTISVEML